MYNKKSTAILLILVMLITNMSGISFAANKLNIGDVTIDSSGTVYVPVVISNDNYDISAVQFDLSYNSSFLTYKGIDIGSMAQNFDLISNGPNNPIRVVMYNWSRRV